MASAVDQLLDDLLSSDEEDGDDAFAPPVFDIKKAPVSVLEQQGVMPSPVFAVAETTGVMRLRQNTCSSLCCR